MTTIILHLFLTNIFINSAVLFTKIYFTFCLSASYWQYTEHRTTFPSKEDEIYVHSYLTHLLFNNSNKRFLRKCRALITVALIDLGPTLGGAEMPTQG